MSAFSDKAIEILQSTHDGNNLDPSDLRLVESAVNGFLTEAGIEAFQKLHENATKPEGYTKPWFHDVEHLTRDLEGYVYWKDKQIEHFSFRNYDEERVEAQQLGRLCAQLEELGAEVTFQAMYSLRHDQGPSALTM
jgi:hypothetical protein